jgi:hypothetical protein
VLRVTLKEGSVVDLNRSDASGFDGGVRCGTHAGRRTSTPCTSARSSCSPRWRSPILPRACTGRCARGKATSPGSSRGTSRSVSGRTSSDGSGDDVRFDTIRLHRAALAQQLARDAHRWPRHRARQHERRWRRQQRSRRGRSALRARDRVVGDVRAVDFAPADSGPGYGDFSPGSEISGP